MDVRRLNTRKINGLSHLGLFPSCIDLVDTTLGGFGYNVGIGMRTAPDLTKVGDVRIVLRSEKNLLPKKTLAPMATFIEG